MRALVLSRRNLKEAVRDPLSLGLVLGLPLLMLVVLQALKNVDAFFAPTSLAPGVALFGFVMLMFSAAMTLTKDRETALFSRLLTTPLTPNEFAGGYSMPYLPVAVIQAAVIFGAGALFGLEIAGNVGLVALVLLIMAIQFIALGMIMGALFTSKQVPFVYMVILLLTIFGGAWMDIEAIGGAFKTVGDWFPFAHALVALRAVMIDGAGVADIASDLWWVAAYAAAAAAGAVAAFRHRMVE